MLKDPGSGRLLFAKLSPLFLVLLTPWPATAATVGSCTVVAVSSATNQTSQVAADEDPPPIDDFSEYTYSVPSAGVGTFADCPISRTFPNPISDIRVTLVSGTADDIGYVGNLQVTDAPPSCSQVGSVQAPVDVTSQVTVSGDTASLVLRALENCCCQTGWGQATQSDRSNAVLHWEVSFAAPKIEITLDPPPANDQYTIDASPGMPTIRAKARVVGLTPDPTPSTTFTWTASLIVHENQPSRDVDFAPDIVQSTTTVGQAPYTLQFNDRGAFRGGRLKLKATATVNGRSLTGETPAGLKIDGANPQRSTIQAYIDGLSLGGHGLNNADVADVFKRMACQESLGQRQFNAAANGGVGPALISFDDGVGLLQITNNPCEPFRGCPDVIFSWQENADAARRVLRDRIAFAAGYPGRLSKLQEYQNFISNTINPQRVAAGRSPIKGAPTANFTTNGAFGSNPPNQLLEDGVRGYNGWAGVTEFGSVLHEFAPDTNFLVNATDAQLRGLNNNPAFWLRVPVDKRPGVGDPDYINNLKAKSPQCGG